MSGAGARRSRIVAALLLCLLAAGQPAAYQPPAERASPGGYIVQSSSAEAAAAAVAAAGGAVERQLAIIDAVKAALAPAAVARLRAQAGVRVYADGPVTAADVDRSPSSGAENGTAGYLLYPSAAVGAAPLHTLSVPTRVDTCDGSQVTAGAGSASAPLEGWGVTVAVIDSGFMRLRDRPGLPGAWDTYDAATGAMWIAGDQGPDGRTRCIVYRDFLPQSDENQNFGAQDSHNSTDQSGHGTHVISSIADNRQTQLAPGFTAAVGVAPKVNLVIARALDANGGGTYATVIDAIQWVLLNRTRYNIRVLNL